jgi:predicted amidohydrolase YtcJ
MKSMRMIMSQTLRSLKGNPADILEEAAPGVPVAIMEKTSHSEWVNRTALKRAGVTRDTPDPVGGIIVRDGDGEPTGLLLDNAGDVLLEQIYKPNKELLDLAYDGLVKKLQEFPAYGLTSIADARVYWTRDHHKVWQRVAAEGKLPVRVVLGIWAYPEMDDRQIEQIGRLHSDEPKSLLRITQVKFYVDGLIANGTARMKAPYDPSIQLAGHPNGLNYFTSDRLSHYIAELEKLGFDAHIHAIGDLGVHEALDAIERAQIINGSLGKARHRITHIETYDRADLGRFVKLGVIADFQVAGGWSAPDIFYDDAKPFIGERARNAIPLRQVYETGATVTLSSDYDVSDPNPFVGMANALTRAPENLPNVDAAIRAYTINAAYTLRQEAWTGSLQVGKRADLVVIDRDIFRIAPKAISKTRPLLTMMDGRVTYRSRKF